jgi:hypothetical protein
MFKNLFSSKSIFTLSLLAAPLLVTQKPYKCAFWSKKKPNTIDERLFLHQINSNKPCEDRYDYRQLKNINAYAAAVYDGHGGWQVVIDSNYFSQNFAKKCFSSILTSAYKKTRASTKAMRNSSRLLSTKLSR